MEYLLSLFNFAILYMQFILIIIKIENIIIFNTLSGSSNTNAPNKYSYLFVYKYENIIMMFKVIKNPNAKRKP